MNQVFKLLIQPQKIKNLFNFNRYCKSTNVSMKILNVAEKNDAAKSIAAHLSRGNSNRREGFSPYNKIYEFEAQVFNQKAYMIMTSVSGHLLTYEFAAYYKNWQSVSPLELFSAPVHKTCPKDYEKIKKTLEREVQSCQKLIIWTDCDREGENIGFEIIDVCREIVPHIDVYRARFSEITLPSIQRALRTLERPNENINNAVNVRQELDLRIGAAFTRLQTLRLRRIFPQKLADHLISYGSCQFPTLGFVVDRYKAIEDFVEQAFWKIKMSHTMNDLTVDYTWGRDRLFDQDLVQVLLDVCQENLPAIVKKITSKPKNKWRPLPLDTIEMEKSASRKLKLNAKRTMQIAENLYRQGLISYPRTETNIFPKELNLTNLIQQQVEDANWGNFANGILGSGGPTPRQGSKSDQAHPPIHPTKYANNLNGDDRRVYEFIVRHFLACCSKDAKGMETIVDVDIGEEKFQAKGLMIIERNYLEVYPYEKWNAKEIHVYQEGQQFTPTVLEMTEGHTTAPPLLTEADLISLMEKFGIGTDATHAEHISTIQSREYVALPDGVHFVPGLLGMGLVEGYDQVGLDVSLAKPNLRAELENDLKLICDGVKQPDVVLREQVNKYESMYRKVLQQMGTIDTAIGQRINEAPAENVNLQLTTEASIPVSPLKCPKCDSQMVVRNRKNNEGKYLSCTSFPACKNAVWLPSDIKEVTVMNETCSTCGPDFKLLEFKFVRMTYGCYTSPHIACLGGCDRDVLDAFNIRLDQVKKRTNNSSAPPSSSSTDSNRHQTTLNHYFSSQSNNERNSNSATSTNRSNNTRPPVSSSNSRNFGSSNSDNNEDSGFNSNNNFSLRTNNLQSNNNFGSRPTNSQNNNFGSRSNDFGTRSTDFGSRSTDFGSRSTDFGTRSTDFGSRSNNSRNSDFGGDSCDLNVVVCGCSQPAVLLTVRKQGPNIGRQFYKCARGKDNGGCDFFVWHSDSSTTSTGGSSSSGYQSTGTTTNNNNHQNNQTVHCNCNEPAVRRTVQKDTPNKGRSFYACAKGQRGCNFFKWDSDADGTSRGNSNDGNDDWRGPGGGGGGDFRGAGSSSSNSNTWRNKKTKSSLGDLGNQPKKRKTNPQTSGKRKCGLCGEEGHNKTKCPHKR